jgi:hypothetical protein
MSVYQLLECHVALAGDILNVVHRDEYRPITYPELLVLRYMHGENAITDIYDVGAVERDDEREMERLCLTYSKELVKDRLFPGAGIRLPNGDNRYKPRVVEIKQLAAAPPPEPVLPPGGDGMVYTPQDRSGPVAFTPTSDPVQDEPDPFGDNPDGPQAPTASDAASTTDPQAGRRILKKG